MRRGIAIALLIVMFWTTTALAFGRACACDPDPPKGGLGGAPGMGGAGAGKGWVPSPGGRVLVPPEYARAINEVKAGFSVRGAYENFKMYRDISRWTLGTAIAGGILYAWWNGDITTEELKAMLRSYLKKQGWEVPAP